MFQILLLRSTTEFSRECIWQVKSITLATHRVSTDARPMLEIGYDADTRCGLYPKIKSIAFLSSQPATG